MDKNPIGELMQNTMENVRSILKVDTVVGDPIYTPDGITLVPISKISVGFGGGGVEFNTKKVGEVRPYGGGNATGVKIDPIGFLVIKDGTIVAELQKGYMAKGRVIRPSMVQVVGN